MSDSKEKCRSCQNRGANLQIETSGNVEDEQNNSDDEGRWPRICDSCRVELQVMGRHYSCIRNDPEAKYRLDPEREISSTDSEYLIFLDLIQRSLKDKKSEVEFTVKGTEREVSFLEVGDYVESDRPHYFWHVSEKSEENHLSLSCFPRDWWDGDPDTETVSLVLEECRLKIATIKALRSMIDGIGLADAKRASESLPYEIFRDIPIEEGKRLARWFAYDTGGELLRLSNFPIGLE